MPLGERIYLERQLARIIAEEAAMLTTNGPPGHRRRPGTPRPRVRRLLLPELLDQTITPQPVTPENVPIGRAVLAPIAMATGARLESHRCSPHHPERYTGERRIPPIASTSQPVIQPRRSMRKIKKSNGKRLRD